MHPFLDHFSNKYKSQLGKRFSTFYKMFEYLISLNKDFYTLIETGTVRRDNALEAEGMSTILFDEFLNFEGIDGNLISIDLDQNNVNFSISKVSSKTQVVCGDSVQTLFDLSQSMDDDVDLFYLDSMDLDWGNPHPSSFHHVQEFCAIIPLLKKGTLLVIDDNDQGKGKGAYVDSYMTTIKKEKLFNEYQIGWVW